MSPRIRVIPAPSLINGTIRETFPHSAVDWIARMLFFAKIREDGVGQAAIADLNRVAVLNADCDLAQAGGHESRPRRDIGGRRSYRGLSAVSPQRPGGFVGQRKYLVFCPP